MSKTLPISCRVNTIMSAVLLDAWTNHFLVLLSEPESLAVIIPTNGPYVTVVPLDWHSFRHFHNSHILRSFLADLESSGCIEGGAAVIM